MGVFFLGFACTFFFLSWVEMAGCWLRWEMSLLNEDSISVLFGRYMGKCLFEL